MATTRYRRLTLAAVGFFTLLAGLLMSGEALAQWIVPTTECTTRADLQVAMAEDGSTEVVDLIGPMARAFAGTLIYPPHMAYDEIMVIFINPYQPLMLVALEADCAVGVSILRATPNEVREALRRAAPEA